MSGVLEPADASGAHPGAPRERDRIFSPASHELGNMLAGAQVWARYLLEHAAADETWRDAAHRILESVDAAHALVKDLVTLARLDEGRLTFTNWPFDVREAASEAVSQIRPAADADGVTIELLPGAERAVIQADAARVRQIMVNVLSAAAKATPRGGRVRVGVEVEAEGVLTWADHEGAGVEPGDEDRIFKPYEQVSTTCYGRAARVGLAIARMVVRHLGGDLWLERRDGAGSTFKLRLPAQAASAG